MEFAIVEADCKETKGDGIIIYRGNVIITYKKGYTIKGEVLALNPQNGRLLNKGVNLCPQWNSVAGCVVDWITDPCNRQKMQCLMNIFKHKYDFIMSSFIKFVLKLWVILAKKR